MAQVTDTIQQRIDRTLSLLTFQWQRLPEVEAEIEQWDLLDRLSFVEAWPAEEERLRRLERYAADGLLAPEQSERFEALKDLIAKHRPIIRRLQTG